MEGYHLHKIQTLRERKAVVDARAQATTQAIMEVDRQTNFLFYSAFQFNCVLALNHPSNNPEDMDHSAFHYLVLVRNAQFANHFFSLKASREKLSNTYGQLGNESAQLETKILQHEDELARIQPSSDPPSTTSSEKIQDSGKSDDSEKSQDSVGSN